MRHILLTGATGFLGSHLAEEMVAEGYEVTIIKRSYSDTWRINHLLKKVNVFDVDTVPLENAFKSRQVDAVIHTACSYGRHDQPTHEVAETNLIFGMRLLDAAISFSARSFLNTDTLLPKYLNSYSLSKKQFSEWLRMRSDGIQVINLKLEHMYGPKDDSTKFVPWLIGQLERGVKRIPLTEGHQLRDFIYIDDVVSAFLVVLKKAEELQKYSEFDVGTGELVSVRKFVIALQMAYQDLHPSSATQLGFGDIPLRNGEVMRVDVDNAGLRELGWAVRTSQHQGILSLLG